MAKKHQNICAFCDASYRTARLDSKYCSKNCGTRAAYYRNKNPGMTSA